MTKLTKMFLGALLALAFSAPAMASDVSVSVQQIAKAGSTPTYTSTGLATGNTYQFNNDGRVFVHFKKTGAGDCTVTVVTQATMQGYAIGDQTVSVAATSGDVFTGPFPASLFNDANELVSFTISDTVGLSIAVLKL